MARTAFFVRDVIACSCCWIVLMGVAFAGEIDPLDWPNWKGPQQNRISAETGLVDSWNPKGGEGSNLLWKNAELGGRSTPIVLRGRLYTIVRDQPGTPVEGEKVVCVDAATGKILWQHRFNVYLSDVPDTRVGWSSCVGDPETGRIYALGVCGYFCCLEGDTGDVVWERSLHEEYGLLSTYGGRTNIPVLYQDTVIISAVVIGWGDTPKWGLLAKPAHRFMAFDKAGGDLRWLRGTRLIPYDTTYSTPMIAQMPQNGQEAMVFGSGDGQVWAMQPATGEPLWNFAFSRRGLNVSPLVAPDGTVYTGHSEENIVGNTMGSIVALDGNLSGDLADKQSWQHFEVMAGKGSPLYIDGRVYFVDDRAKLFIYDAATGELIQRKALGTVMRSTPLYADGKLYLCTNNGRWYILEPTPNGVKVVHKLRLSGEASDGSPIVSHGRIYVPTSHHLYCIGREDHEPSTDPKVVASWQPAGVPGHAADQQPAHMQVVPYDVLLRPGEQQTYRVRLFNQRGEFLSEASADDVEFSLDGAGTISQAGQYVAPDEDEHRCALISCHVGELSGTARIRVVPPLPWQFDFEDLDDVPLTWVGGRVRYVVSDLDEGRVMIKRSELPTRPGARPTKLGTRSRMWMGPTHLANYTIQADVMLPTGEASSSAEQLDETQVPEFPTTSSSIKMGDIGLINSRYTFALYGASQEVRLYSWCTHDKRTQDVKSFEIQPFTWYTLKVTAQVEGDHAVVKGKVWPQGENEPDQWTLEISDPEPNRHGSPGLFGNAKDAEIFVDNLIVTPN